MPEQQPKNVRKWSNMAPDLVQVGVILGSKIVLDVSKGEKNASQRPLEKRIRKSIEKPRSGEAPRREVQRGGDAKWPDFWPYLVDF